MSEIQPENHKARHTCSSSGGKATIVCHHCKHRCIKYGTTQAGKQRFRCLDCKRTPIAHCSTAKPFSDLNTQIKILLKEGCGTRSIGRILKVSVSTVNRSIKKIGSSIIPPAIESRQVFELDEIYTFIGNKSNLIWIAYAINRTTKQVVAFNIGNRALQMLSQVTELLLKTSPLTICTDKLLQYKSLIPSAIHCTKKYSINHIEHKNLTLRTHLKRLNRRTICFSKSIAMLHACLMIYFFG